MPSRRDLHSRSRSRSRTTGELTPTGAAPERVREDRGRLLVALHVTTRAARDDLSFDGTALRVRVTAPPVAGAANTAVIALLARRLRVPKGSVEIVRGSGSRDKLVAIEGIVATELRVRLEG